MLLREAKEILKKNGFIVEVSEKDRWLYNLDTPAAEAKRLKQKEYRIKAKDKKTKKEHYDKLAKEYKAELDKIGEGFFVDYDPDENVMSFTYGYGSESDIKVNLNDFSVNAGGYTLEPGENNEHLYEFDKQFDTYEDAINFAKKFMLTQQKDYITNQAEWDNFTI